MSADEVIEVAERPQPQPGPFGPYLLQELINSGGMSDIWLATDADHKPFALRRLHSNSPFNFAARKRFVRGCEVLSQIHSHELVIGYIEHGKIEGSLYLLMEYVEGSNLKQLINRQDSVLVENVANLLIDMAVSIEHVHDSGFMHLDFKPENVLVTRNANIRLLDFDLAMPRPEKPKRSSKNPGTPGYMAPEQLLREPFDHRADLFAFGVTAYEVLTGQKPFPGETPEEILRRQLTRGKEFLPPSALNPDIPATLEKSILRCLERDPEKRYPIMSVLVHELKSALYV